MLPYLLRRLLLAPVVLFVLVTVSFFIVRAAPGGPFQAEVTLNADTRRALEAKYRLDRPVLVQYGWFLADLARGDLGPSYTNRTQSVNKLIGRYLPVSLYLGAIALLIAVGLGLSLGVAGAVRKGGAIDHAGTLLAMLLVSVPTFVIGPLLALLFGLYLGWLPVAEYRGPWAVGYLVMPALTMAAPFVGRIARLTRSGLLDVIHADHVRTARAKGAGEGRVILRHALPVGLLPVVSFLGPAVAALLTGSLVVELLFQIPGLGREFTVAAVNRDYTLVLGTVIVYGALVVLSNLASDVLIGLIDPRARRA